MHDTLFREADAASEFLPGYEAAALLSSCLMSLPRLPEDDALRTRAKLLLNEIARCPDIDERAEMSLGLTMMECDAESLLRQEENARQRTDELAQRLTQFHISMRRIGISGGYRFDERLAELGTIEAAFGNVRLQYASDPFADGPINAVETCTACGTDVRSLPLSSMLDLGAWMRGEWREPHKCQAPKTESETDDRYSRLALRLDLASRIAGAECLSKMIRLDPLHSCHEAYALILEDLEGVWAEVRKSGVRRNRLVLRSELVKVAASALRAIVDLDIPLPSGMGETAQAIGGVNSNA